jgi:hypothetical protein
VYFACVQVCVNLSVNLCDFTLAKQEKQPKRQKKKNCQLYAEGLAVGIASA